MIADNVIYVLCDRQQWNRCLEQCSANANVAYNPESGHLSNAHTSLNLYDWRLADRVRQPCLIKKINIVLAHVATCACPGP